MKRYFIHTLSLILFSTCIFTTSCNTSSKKEDHSSHKNTDNHKEDHDSEDHKDHDEHDHDSHNGEEGVVTLNEEAIRRSGIVVGAAQAGVLTGSINVSAEIQFNPDQVAHVSPLVGGHLLSVDVSIGDRVEGGEGLAELRSVELGQARAELSRTASLRNVKSRNLERQRKLRKEGISSEKSLLEAEFEYEQANAELQAARARLQVFGIKGGVGPDMTLKSPISGTVIERHATRGENVTPADTLFVVANLSHVWVIGRVFEQQISSISPGMNATLTLSAYPSRHWSGKVDYVGQTIDGSTRSLPVRVEIENPDGLLRPGLFGSLKLSREDQQNESVLVPASAVQTYENRSVVFVPESKTSFKALPITIGTQGLKEIEILKGLKPGDPVVVQGAFILKSELVRSELGHGHSH